MRLQALLLAVLLATGVPAFAQADPGTGPAIEPEAVAALDRMGKYLGTLKAFSVKGAASTEEVLPQGLKVRHDTASTMEVVRPDHVRAEQSSMSRHRLIVYDGETFSLYSKSSGYYAQVPAKATIGQLADKLEAEYAVELPLLNLFAWADQAQRPALERARVVGRSDVRGTPCDQYVYRQGKSEVQVWVQRGAQPLPRRVAVTALANEARPQYTADYDWTLNAQAAPTAFKFTPPAGAISIPLKRVKELVPPRAGERK